MPLSRKKTVLVSPLDWGLGHATRCVPVIQELIHQQVEVIIGTSGLSGHWLKKTFPHLESVPVPYHEIRYHSWLPMEITALMRYPSIRKMIAAEHQWLLSFCRHRKIDGIISDNRYGLYHPSIHSVCITHQMYVQPGRWRFIQPLLNQITHSYLKPFRQIWVPDFEGPFNLSGSLSHPTLLSHNIQYIGPLSRFWEFKIPRVENYTYKVAFIISGPEPHRTTFEKACLKITKELNLPSVIIRGTDTPMKEIVPDCCKIIHIADTEQLFQIICQSEQIVSRAGYSSIMDWYALKKSALLIPTPGQTEQEYLSKYLKQTHLFYSVHENELTADVLTKALDQPPYETNKTMLSSVIHNWLCEI